MARTTRAQRIEHENEEQAFACFLSLMRSVRDPRRAQGRRYPLPVVIIVALLASVCGCDNAESMQQWGEDNELWLSQFLDMPHGTPTQDVFLSVFASLNPDELEALLGAWCDFVRERLNLDDKHIAIDGKTSRRSGDKAKGKRPLHMVSAYLTEQGVVLAARKTRDKSNEITAIEELLPQLKLDGATVTIDAIGTQVKVAQAIVQGQGDYLLAVKDNQPTLYDDVVETFAQAHDKRVRAFDELPAPQIESFEEMDKGHGRLEHRQVHVCRDLTWMTSRWPGLTYVVQVVRERTSFKTGKTSRTCKYYIGSDASATAEKVARLIRRHWAIENELHWLLDMAYGEDQARHRAKHAAHNMSILRRFSLNLVKQNTKRKLGVESTRLRAGWTHDYLIRLLHGTAQ